MSVSEPRLLCAAEDRVSSVLSSPHPSGVFTHLSFHPFVPSSFQVYDADRERDPPRRCSRLVPGLLPGRREGSKGSEGHPAWEQARPHLQHRQVGIFTARNPKLLLQRHVQREADERVPDLSG